MSFPEVFALCVVLAVLGLFAAVFVSCRRQRKAERAWHERNMDPLVKGAVSFDEYAPQNRRSRAIAAAYAKR